MSVVPDEPELLGAPYFAPRIQVGDRAFCLLRDCDVIITSITDARIPWPRCQPIGRRGGCGLLLDETLARAVRTESATALAYYWGVSEGVVWRWRKVFAIGRTGSEGSKRLVQAAAQLGAEAVQAKEWTLAERQAARRHNRRFNLVRNLQPGYHGPRWTAEQLALLGTLPDAEVAGRTGRTVNAVRCRRERMGIARGGK